METLDKIYWIKLFLGAATALICVVLRVNDIFLGAAIGVATYAFSDRILRQLFIDKVEKPFVVTKTGYGIYVLSLAFFWVLLYTLF